ncbi:MAG TPA: hypothetical protein VHE78_02995 [Gemmatimonadaceae bacterium]|nr:hypothetical protein [Gemmatimonadaceae bacterium]
MMPRIARILTALASVTLLGLFIAPLWRINLTAPQYPEGLGMQISVSSIHGRSPNDLNNINGLNHYIGMKVITPEAIPELRIIPWIVAGLAASGLAVAVGGKRKLLSAWLVCFALVGAGGLLDFWKWEYDYGHNIDYAHAIIKIPGMSYQPPLMGVKQLLNFTAVSWPDVGGWLAGFAFALGAAAVTAAWWSRKPALAA